MVELAKSTISFSWAMSLFGFQQLANVFKPQDTRQPAAAFYAVRQASAEQFNDLIWATFVVGNELQSDMVDLMFDALTLKAFTPSYIATLTSGMTQQSVESFRVLLPGENCRLAWQTLKNNYEVFNLVKHVRSLLHIPSGPNFPLEELIEKAYALGQYPDLWAVEGLGHDYTDTFWGQNEPIRNILTNEKASALPAKSLTMMHAGMGLSFAQHLLRTITSYSPASEIRQVLQEFVTLCQDNSRKGYIGAAYESLGLVTRTWHAEMVSIIDRLLPEIDQEVVGYFWHGVGRALYFFPLYFVPGLLSPWRAAEQEPPHELGRRNATAGLAWAVTLVNMRQPEIMANLLKYQEKTLSKSDAFSNGVISSIMMGHDITPGDVYITAFCQYQPDPAVPGLVEAWNEQVGYPCQEALQRLYPVLKKHHRLDEVFHYQNDMKQLLAV